MRARPRWPRPSNPSTVLPGVLMMWWLMSLGFAGTPVDRLDWLAGCWEDASGTEECWMAPRDGLMVGVGRSPRKNGSPFFEYFRIEHHNGKTQLVASPRGASSTAFVLIEQTPTRAVFDNPTHDFPQRITYERTSTGLQATISGSQKGAPATVSWTYTRATGWPRPEAP